MSELVLRAEGLTRAFGEIVAVNKLDLTIRKGTIYGLLGPNGSGKTTAMRLLTGLLTPTSGQAIVLGNRLPGNSEKLKSRIGYMTQGFSHYRDLSVLENLRFAADIYGLPRQMVRERIERLLDIYSLGDQTNVLAANMSGGQRQRLALAAATIHEPEFLFLDEPTASVDPQSRRGFWEQLFDLVENGTSLLVSTHLMDEAERCHRIAILDHGRKRADGSPRELMDRIASRVVEVSGGNLREMTQHLMAAEHILSVAHIGMRLRVLVSGQVSRPLSLVEELLANFTGHETAHARPNMEDVFVSATLEGKT